MNRFFYGYIIVIASFFIMLAYSASRSAFGISFDPILAEFAWSAALLSGSYSLSIVMDGTLGILMGKFTDSLGPRRVLIICGLLAGLGYILLSRVTAIWQMYLVYGVLIGGGMAGVFIPVIATLPRWFIARRNTMNGIVLAGMGVGTLVISPIAYWLISTHDWQFSYIVIGLAFLFIVLLSALFMKLDPVKAGQSPYNKPETSQRVQKAVERSYSLKEALRTRLMWLVFSMFFCFGFSVMALTVHIVPHIIDIGISPATAAFVMATIGGVNIAGRLAFGGIGDKIGSLRTYALGFAVIAASGFWLLFIKDAWMFYIFAVAWGFCAGGMASVQPTIVAECFGVKSMGSIFGACGLGIMIGGSLSPVFAGFLFDILGNYQLAFLICASFAVAGFLINLVLQRYRLKAASTQ
jgi:OFA family oxalate/formate antiporter-like MFS transporter